MANNSKKHIAVITGASAGVGRATALQFAKKGAGIGLISRNLERLESLKAEIEKLGVPACIAITDVANADEVERAAELIEKELGPIDIWINNAMASVFSPFQEIEVDEFKRVTEVTYLGTVYGTKSALKRMIPRDRGMILQVGSALAYRGIPLQSPYCGAKHAIQGFTESLRSELMHAKSKVKITMLQMPALNTPQFNWVKSRLPRKAQPVPPIYQPEVAANAIFWASRHYRREWYVCLSTTIVIVLNQFFPGMGDRYLAKHGFESQQYDGSENPNRPNNLFKSVDGSYGAHGAFDQKAKAFSLHLWIDQRIKYISLAALIVVLILLATFG